MLENQGNRSLTSVHDGNLKIVAVEECWEVYLLDDSRSHQIDKTYHHTADNRTFLERNSYKVWPSLILEAYKERHWFTRDLQIKQDHQSFFLFLTEWMNVHNLYQNINFFNLNNSQIVFPVYLHSCFDPSWNYKRFETGGEKSLAVCRKARLRLSTTSNKL